MAGISLSVEGDKIQLSFQKDDQATAILMDAGAARTLVAALSQLLSAMAEESDGEGDAEFDDDEEDVLDVTSPMIEVGTDEEGKPVVALQAGNLPPFLLRLKDDEARHMAESLLEILNAPQDARTSQGGH